MIYYNKTNHENQFYSENKTLSELANQYETDKGTADKMSLSWGSNFHSHYTWGYTEIYEKYMKDFRNTEIPVEFFEIGICDSRFPFASPKVWLSYFKNINLYCVDNFWGSPPSQQNVDYVSSLGVNFFYADQGSESDWLGIYKHLPNLLDFIVEDGSHYPHHMLCTLLKSIPILKSGGYYFMEDLQHETTINHYGYNNYSVYKSVVEFNSTGKFHSPLLSESECKEIESAYIPKEIHLGGPSHCITALCVLQKK